MKKNRFSLGALALALTFTFVACEQDVVVKNWSDQYDVTVPAFSVQPAVSEGALRFNLTAASASAVGSTNVQYVCKIEGKNGFFLRSAATVTYNFATDDYSCIDSNFRFPASFVSGRYTIRVGIVYSTPSSVYKYTWSNPIEVTKL
jgi:hypothetical protein